MITKMKYYIVIRHSRNYDELAARFLDFKEARKYVGACPREAGTYYTIASCNGYETF